MFGTDDEITRRRAEGLQRFIDAQARTHATALAELIAGRKRSHWMWWTFPQEPRPGTSTTSQIYALELPEAREYAHHPQLSARLRELTEIVCEHLRAGTDLEMIFGHVDALKFRSCMELFAEASEDPVFQRALTLTRK